jgi:hypothetical protein
MPWLPILLMLGQPAPPAPPNAIFMFETGASLLAKCRNRAPEYRLACTAYIVGAVDGIKREAFQGRPLTNCWPAQIPAEEVRRIVVSYLERTVSEHGAPASVLVGVALDERFPCRG